jgi:hypothetical protein
MTWYHTTDDAADSIDYRSVRVHLRFFARAIAWFANSEERYDNLGEQQLTPEDASEMSNFLQGVLGSRLISDAERDTAADLLAQFQAVVKENDVTAVENIDDLYYQTALFAMFRLTTSNPGNIPPPFPPE